MKKKVFFLILAIAILSNTVGSCRAIDKSGFAVGPTQLLVTTFENSSNSTYVYITSYVDGELAVGTENLPFRIEPETISIESSDQNRKIHLTVHGNTSLSSGQYNGKLTFLFYTANNVAHGVKINTTIVQTVPERVPNWLDNIIDWFIRNGLVVVAIAGVVVALTFGFFIGKKSKKHV
jgi:hypothetical protein